MTKMLYSGSMLERRLWRRRSKGEVPGNRCDYNISPEHSSEQYVLVPVLTSQFEPQDLAKIRRQQRSHYDQCRCSWLQN